MTKVIELPILEELRIMFPPRSYRRENLRWCISSTERDITRRLDKILMHKGKIAESIANLEEMRAELAQLEMKDHGNK